MLGTAEVGEEGRGSGRRAWGQQVGVRQRPQEDLTPSLGCKATVAVEGKQEIYTKIQEYHGVMKRKIAGTLPCMGEEKGRQTGVMGGSPVSQRA